VSFWHYFGKSFRNIYLFIYFNQISIMKNLVKIASVFALVMIVLASCSKDQKCVNWLEGQWTISKIEVTDSTGVTVNVFDQLAALGGSITGTMDFTKYSVKNDENGNATIITVATILGQTERDTTNFEYKIQDDCETVWLKESGATTGETSTIEEASKSKMVFSSYDATDKETTRITIEK
jgi:hypothetical protein